MIGFGGKRYLRNFVFITLADATDVQKLTPHLPSHFPRARPRIVEGMPTRPIGADSLDLTPSKVVPMNCRVKCCPHYNLGMPGAFETTIQAMKHGITFHDQLYRSLPNDTLLPIHWSKCVEGCDYLGLGEPLLREHQRACDKYLAIRQQ